MNITSTGNDPLEQIAMTAIKRSKDQQEINGQNALALIHSAAPQQLQSQQAVQVVGETAGANIDTYA